MDRNEQISEILSAADSLELYFSSTPTIRFRKYPEWFNLFPDEPGVYVIYDINRPVYIGEAANLHERMRDLRNTYTHPYRKALGTLLQPGASIPRNKTKYNDSLEAKLDSYFISNISVAYKIIYYGRTELQEHLIYRFGNRKIINTLPKKKRHILPDLYGE